MKTIPIPITKLIKYIPSEPDGGVIPGAVVRCDKPTVERTNPYEFKLKYTASSKTASQDAACKLDEELDVVSGSNAMQFLSYEDACEKRMYQGVRLELDGVNFCLESIRLKAGWHFNACHIPDPFDALGKHELSSFVPFGPIRIACCVAGFTIRLAVIKKDANLISESVIESNEPLTFGPPCQHNVGWLIPWASESKGINIAWLDDAEMDRFVSQAQPLPKA